jgi:hypothetical protein
LTSLTYEDIQKLQGSQARKESQKNIIVNDLDAAFDAMQRARREKKDGERRVDIVLDNSGFELFVDMILAGYLLSAGLATSVVLHPKRLPWFVSDVTPKDFSDLLNSMVDPQAFYTAADESGKTFPSLSEKEISDVKFLFNQWSEFHQDGKLILRPHAFWTAQGGFWRMPHDAPELFEDLKESELVLFKGDLNYRKLTNDVSWYSLFVTFGLMLTMFRPNGIPQPPSQRLLAHSAPSLAFVFWPSALARLTLSLAFQKGKMRSFARCLAAVALSLASGPGVENGLLFHCLMARPKGPTRQYSWQTWKIVAQ